MTRRSAGTAGTIGQQAGTALDSVVQPMQSAANSVRETVSSAFAGMAGFMKQPSEAMARRSESAMRTVAEVVKPRASRKTRAAIKTTARPAVKVTKPAAGKTASRKPAAARARTRRQR